MGADSLRKIIGTTYEVTPVVDTNIYASGDRLGSILTLTDFFQKYNRSAEITGLSLLDKAKQKSVLQVLFFDELPTVASADNATLDITDAEMADKCLGYLPVAAADYKDLSASSIATVLPASPLLVTAKTTSLYAIILSGGTPTYTSASDLVLRLHVRQL